jgi:5-hydroxyisourate hydrolase
VYNPFVLSPITTHVLDVSLGRPAVGVAVVLERGGQNQWTLVGHGTTDADGRMKTLMAADAALAPGVYRLVFDTRRYFEGRGIQSLYPSVVVIFDVAPNQPHYHIPLLLSPFGYTTYRGS